MRYEEIPTKIEDSALKGVTMQDLQKFGVDCADQLNDDGPFLEQKNELVASVDRFIRSQPLEYSFAE